MTRDDLIDFVYDEAATIDQMRWDDWLALFHKDGRYWMPLEWQQEDPILQPSLMYEDRLLLTVRVERLAGERTFSQKPKSRCHHLMERPRILSMGEDGGVLYRGQSELSICAEGKRPGTWVTQIGDRVVHSTHNASLKGALKSNAICPACPHPKHGGARYGPGRGFTSSRVCSGRQRSRRPHLAAQE